MTDIKKLIGNEISEDTASALQTILDTALNESASEKDKIVTDLTEQLTERKNEVDSLNDKINELTESLKSVETNSAKEIQDLVRRRLSTHAYPREVEFVKELPKTPSGKIQRFLLRSLSAA